VEFSSAPVSLDDPRDSFHHRLNVAFLGECPSGQNTLLADSRSMPSALPAITLDGSASRRPASGLTNTRRCIRRLTGCLTAVSHTAGQTSLPISACRLRAMRNLHGCMQQCCACCYDNRLWLQQSDQRRQDKPGSGSYQGVQRKFPERFLLWREATGGCVQPPGNTEETILDPIQRMDGLGAAAHFKTGVLQREGGTP